MKTFRNTHFTKRNYECTNIVAVQSPEMPTHHINGQPCQPGDYEECDSSILEGLTPLGGIADLRFHGYL